MGSREKVYGNLEEKWSRMKGRVLRAMKEVDEEKEEKIGERRQKGGMRNVEKKRRR